jgi:bacterioferritin
MADFCHFRFLSDGWCVSGHAARRQELKGDPKIIELLNEALKAELTAINQYWLHYRLLDNWGMHKIAQFERRESIDEMKHADRFSERILFLEGLPNFQALGRLRIGETVEEILNADLEAEYEAVEMYRNGVQACEAAKDYVSRDLFAEVLRDEERHVDLIETQLEMIKHVGLQNYIQMNSGHIEGE